MIKLLLTTTTTTTTTATTTTTTTTRRVILHSCYLLPAKRKMTMCMYNNNRWRDVKPIGGIISCTSAITWASWGGIMVVHVYDTKVR